MPKLSNKKVIPEFFKIYISELASQLMRIPPDFIVKFGGAIPTSFTLKRPKREEVSWLVDTKKMDDHWYFFKGWPEFVEENMLLDGDFITFTLVGKSTFCVTIFSPNGCLKGVTTDYKITSDDQTSKSESEDSEPEIYQTDRIFTLPKRFWNEYMKKKFKKGSAVVTLWVKNDAWNVNLKLDGDRVKLYGGFSKFIENNSIKVGTTCTFQLIETNPFSFRVTFSM